MVAAMQEFCSCGRGEKVIFACMKPECPNHKKQPLYCVQCSALEPYPHDHRGSPISYETSSISNQWMALRKEVSAKLAVVDAWMEKYSDLLTLLTTACEVDSLLKQIMKLRELEQNVQNYY